MNRLDTPNKKIFFVCLFFFLILQAYGIYYSALRMQFEGAEDTILTCLGNFRIPFHRYAYILNKVLFLFALKLHLPFKTVSAIYSLNDGLFYLAVSFLIIFFTRRFDYAATVLAAPILLHDSVFYFIANELFLSGSIMLLFVAVHKYMQDGISKNLLLGISAFFIIWSHPITLLILLLFSPFAYPTLESLKRNWKVLLFIFVNIAARLILLSNYDYYKLSGMKGALFEKHFWYAAVADYFNIYWYLALIGVCVLIIAVRSKQKILYSGLLLLPVLIACCNSSEAHVGEQYFIKFLYPLQLFILLQLMIFIHALPPGYTKWAVPVIAWFLFLGGQRLIENNHKSAYNKAIITQRLNTLCAKQDPKQSKWYIRQDVLNMKTLFYTDECHESLFYSVYQNQSPTIQLAQVREEEFAKLDSVGNDSLLANMHITYPIKQLDSYYFHVISGRYKELLLDSAKRQFLISGLE